LSGRLQQVDETWTKTKAISLCMSACVKMAEWSADHLIHFLKYKSNLENCGFGRFFIIVRDMVLMLPLCNTCSHAEAEVPQTSNNEEHQAAQY